MGLNKQKGNMYGWVTHTWNTVKGQCPHDCVYCYMKSFKLNPIRFDHSELKTDLGSGNVIFVGSSCDMWADVLPVDWIKQTLAHCCEYPDNEYLFQSKNPSAFHRYMSWMPPNFILGATIESDIDHPVSKAPCIKDKVAAMVELDCRKMVSVEPILKFNLDQFTSQLKSIGAEFISIGADSKRHNLPEPSKDEVAALIENLRGTTRLKDNLGRLL